MSGRDAENALLVEELGRGFPDGQRLLDPFSGRGMIPLESAHLAVQSFGVDYSPVAAVASRLLVDYPLRDFSKEPDLGYGMNPLLSRLPQDVAFYLAEVKAHAYRNLEPFYPEVNGKRPWGYLWAMTLPCQECRHRFPLVGALTLRKPNPSHDDLGQSLHLYSTDGEWHCDVIDGDSPSQPTRIVAQGKSKYDAAGKVAVCLHCGHVHPKDVHTRLAADGFGVDALLAVAENDDRVQRRFRAPTPEEGKALEVAGRALTSLEPFENGLAPIPTERIPPGNTWTIQSTVYGARTYADLCNPRQNLAFHHIARSIDFLCHDYVQRGISTEYANALAEYATSVMARRLKFSTRGARLRTPAGGARGHEPLPTLRYRFT
jgi:adenine-specific DNA methylase